MSRSLEIAGRDPLPLDAAGYLLDWQAWSEAVAEAMAAADGIELADAHWRVIRILREYYGEYEIAPPMRALVRVLQARSGDDSFGSRQLYQLFPEGPAKQACRYAGLPRPVSCI